MTTLADLNAPFTGAEDAMTREYPPPVAQPCRECPWRIRSASGYLGPYTAWEWIGIVHGEAPIACHLTIPTKGGWGKKTKQCAGAAAFRANVCKSPRNPTIASGPSRGDVFQRDADFIAHHTKEKA